MNNRRESSENCRGTETDIICQNHRDRVAKFEAEKPDGDVSSVRPHRAKYLAAIQAVPEYPPYFERRCGRCNGQETSVRVCIGRDKAVSTSLGKVENRVILDLNRLLYDARDDCASLESTPAVVVSMTTGCTLCI